MKWLENISEKFGRLVGRFLGGRTAQAHKTEITELLEFLISEGFDQHGLLFCKVVGEVMLMVMPGNLGSIRISAVPLWESGSYLWHRDFCWDGVRVDEVKASLATMNSEILMLQKQRSTVN